jgi:ribosomal protein S18 acetylase RimI-like enzyme
MSARVIQGVFIGNQSPKLSPLVQPKLPAPPPIQPSRAPASAFALRPPGPPTAAVAARIPGPPAPAFAGRGGAVQRHDVDGAFAVEAGPLGLAPGGGRPLPEAVRGKMEAALGADFANVRVHVGSQAERIGAIAFTVGSDIYFAPGRYQPDTTQGQQLLGHELAHVVQQRAGRVRNPLGSGLAVVQNHALEAEADRLGRQAAAHRVAAQPKMPPGASQPSAPVRISAPISAGPSTYRLTAGSGGRQVGSVMIHTRDQGAVEITDLGVDPSQRGHGIGRMLVASAAKTGLQFAKTKVTLAAQDKGSGHLTRWYNEMGFIQKGVNRAALRNWRRRSAASSPEHFSKPQQFSDLRPHPFIGHTQPRRLSSGRPPPRHRRHSPLGPARSHGRVCAAPQRFSGWTRSLPAHPRSCLVSRRPKPIRP